jgi:hypothetical protein
MKNMEESQVQRIVETYGKYRRKPSSIVKRYNKCGRKIG